MGNPCCFSLSIDQCCAIIASDKALRILLGADDISPSLRGASTPKQSRFFISLINEGKLVKLSWLKNNSASLLWPDLCSMVSSGRR